MVDWGIFKITNDKALSSFKASVGAEIVKELLSIPDTIAFIEFIYEEAAQTALFALYQAYKNGDNELAAEVKDYIKFKLLPDAVAMIGGWGKLNPATQTCFERFFDAVEESVKIWDKILTVGPPGFGMLVIYSDTENTDVTVDGKEVGLAGPTQPAKVQVEAGKHEIVAKAEGKQVTVKHYNVKAGEVLTIKLNMVAL